MSAHTRSSSVRRASFGSSTNTLSPNDCRLITPAGTPEKPIANSYWATPYLIACEYPWPGASPPPKTKLDALLGCGVRTFIDLTEAGELLPYSGACLDSRAEALGINPLDVEYFSFPIHDRTVVSSVSYMNKILAVLKDNEKRGRISVVHCRGGIGRTGMVVGCYLVDSGRAKDGPEALKIIARQWRTVEKCQRYPHSPETGPQFEFVVNFPRPKSVAA